MDKRFWAIIGIIVVIFGGLIFVNNNKKDASTDTGDVSATNHVLGKTDSKITLLEYGDFQCPACESFFPVVEAVQEKYNDQIKFQFRNLPLTSIHANAFAGSRAAEAADMQGKFWEMYDTLYDSANWSQWSPATTKDPRTYFWGYAKNLGLDVEKFKTDFASSTVNKRINADMAAFNKTGQNLSTPSFFLNGTFIENSKLLDANGQPSVENFSKLIDAEIAKIK